MAKSYKIANADIFLFSEEVTTNPANEIKYYDSICKCNGNTIVIGESIKEETSNIIQEIIDGIEEIFAQYLANVLNNNQNVLVLIGKDAADKSFYTIYYGYSDNLLLPFNLFRWMNTNNDFAVDDKRFTEVRNKHQTEVTL